MRLGVKDLEIVPTACSRAASAGAALAGIVLAALTACMPKSVVPDATPAAAHASAHASALRVMSFNLRYNNPADGVNAWPNRRDWVASLMRFHEVDIVGVQEALAPMLGDLDARMPGFARFGVGRTDGVADGEFSAILYRKERLSVQDSGTFWLSPTPTVVGSKGWDAALERIATWGRFRDRRTGCAFLMLNTHFDHVGEVARQNSARVIREQLLKLAGALPIVVTGDLNSDPTSGGYRVLTRDTLANAVAPLLDGFTHSVSPHYGPTSSWTAFKAIEPGRRIDYVMVSRGVTVLSHGILPDSWDGRFPSDHLPVLATVAPCH